MRISDWSSDVCSSDLRLEQTLLDKDQLKALRKTEGKAEKAAKKNKDKPAAKSRVFVLDFDGDIKASATESLRHEITALLTLATPKDEEIGRASCRERECQYV